MRGSVGDQGGMFSYVTLEARIPDDHPLRAIRAMTDAALRGMSRKLGELYSDTGRPSIPPEHLLRALVVQVLFSVRSERLLVEQLHYNLLFRWFVGLQMDDRVWDVTVFTKNRDRLLRGDVAQAFFAQVIGQAREAGLLSDEHFTVDGTLLEACAGHKSFRPKDGDGGAGGKGGERNFRGEQRKNDTHRSTTDPEARLYKKGAGKEAKLCFLGHAVADNRHGLLVGTQTTQASGTAEREAAERLLRRVRRRRRATVGGDKGYDQRAFVDAMRKRNVTPHVAQNESNRRRSAIDGRTTRHAGYGISQWKRKAIEQSFGWMKSVGLMHKMRHRGIEKVGWVFTFTAAVYDMVRMRPLLAEVRA